MYAIFDEFNNFDDKRKKYDDEDVQHLKFDINQNGEDKQTPSSQDP